MPSLTYDPNLNNYSTSWPLGPASAAPAQSFTITNSNDIEVAELRGKVAALEAMVDKLLAIITDTGDDE